jgi:hypothetical protein
MPWERSVRRAVAQSVSPVHTLDQGHDRDDTPALITEALPEPLHQSPIDEATLRRVLREELQATG